MEVDANTIWWEMSDIMADLRAKDIDKAMSKLNDLMAQFDEDEDEDEDNE